MMFMNSSDIAWKKEKYRSHPVLSKATVFLSDFMEMIDQNSDGWAYWSLAPKSAKRLMELIQDGPEKATEERLRKAIAPIRSLCTRKGLPCPVLR